MHCGILDQQQTRADRRRRARTRHARERTAGPRWHDPDRDTVFYVVWASRVAYLSPTVQRGIKMARVTIQRNVPFGTAASTSGQCVDATCSCAHEPPAHTGSEHWVHMMLSISQTSLLRLASHHPPLLSDRHRCSGHCCVMCSRPPPQLHLSPAFPTIHVPAFSSSTAEDG